MIDEKNIKPEIECEFINELGCVTENLNEPDVIFESSVDEIPCESEEEPKKDEKSSSKIGEFFGKYTIVQKFKAWTKRKPELWQLIKFTLVSMLAGITEITSTAILAASLRNVHTPVEWFIFNYPDRGVGTGLGLMITVLVATALAQIVAFVVNRKKTFQADNNIVFSIVSYAAMVVVLLIGVRMWSTPLLENAIYQGIGNQGLALTLVTAIWMALSFAITFVFSKFIIMRKVKPKKDDSLQTTDNSNDSED